MKWLFIELRWERHPCPDYLQKRHLCERGIPASTIGKRISLSLHAVGEASLPRFPTPTTNTVNPHMETAYAPSPQPSRAHP